MIVVDPRDVERRMLPLEGETLEDLLSIAQHNCRLFDQARFAAWRQVQPGSVQKLAKARPPDRVYRIVSDAEVAGEAHERKLWGIILGYREGSRGEPAFAAVQVLGIKEGLGAHETPLLVPAEVLAPL